jgi:hypothetical protein
MKSEKSTFALKSKENKNHADKNYYQIIKWNLKNYACLEINFIKAISIMTDQLVHGLDILYKHCKWHSLCTNEHKETQRTTMNSF